MKKIFCSLMILFCFLFVFADEKSDEEKTESEIQKRQDTIMYGMESDVISLLTTLTSEKDDMFSNKILLLKDLHKYLKLNSPIKKTS